MCFSVSQAAALCGVTVHQLAEWTELGYVHAVGKGDRRFYNRESLRQILALRRSFEQSARKGLPDAEREARSRPEEFFAPEQLNDEHLALQVQMFFAMNPSGPQTAAGLARRFGVELDRAVRAVRALVVDGSLQETETPAGLQYHAGRLSLPGPRVREQRIRATRRRRLPAQPEGSG